MYFWKYGQLNKKGNGKCQAINKEIVKDAGNEMNCCLGHLGKLNINSPGNR